MFCGPWEYKCKGTLVLQLVIDGEGGGAAEQLQADVVAVAAAILSFTT